MDTNIVTLIGRLTRDPETKQTGSGSTLCKFSLASSRWDGKEKKPGYFDCVAFGKTAETVGKYLKKGSQICVHGSLVWSSWETQEGKKNSKVEIMVNSFQFLDTKTNSENVKQEFTGEDETIPF
jgi:single-strand DNA-binding protein